MLTVDVKWWWLWWKHDGIKSRYQLIIKQQWSKRPVTAFLPPLSSNLLQLLSHHIWSEYSQWCRGEWGLCCRWRQGLQERKKHNLICVIIKYWSRLRIMGWCNPNFTESGSKCVCLVAHCAGWWACGWRCGWCRSGPGSTGCCGQLQSHTGHRNLCTQSLPEPWWGPPDCAGFWWTLRPPQTWGWWAEEGNNKNKGGQEGQVQRFGSELM